MTLITIAMLIFALQDRVLASDATSGGDRLTQPAPTFAYSRNVTVDAVLTSSVDLAFKDKTWDGAPELNVKTFTEAFEDASFKSLGNMIDSVVPSCGSTLTAGKPVNVSALASMIWQSAESGVGFSHHGPCEAWIDSVRVFRADCCRQRYRGYPAEIPIDFSKCPGECRFTFYWLSLDEPQWLAYKQCVPIVYSGSNTIPSYSNATVGAEATLKAEASILTSSEAGWVYADDAENAV